MVLTIALRANIVVQPWYNIDTYMHILTVLRHQDIRTSLMLDLSLLLNNGCLIQPLSEKVIIILPRFSPIIKNR